ncbi:hypothetical protein [Terribacillus sp. DMT04]|uniref:hypothetical protein n=1 Tax=Terribacillus sp. DMT04 TaxID=2850441 RepID=UPI001C2C7410|nr:hypothetical protein [Terribacillus sp. DMT04]QXE02368.1 hypothetical protein KS242_03845 [Terribacillus sp. DMT04]
MEFPMIMTNFWDAVLGVPIVLIFTQIVKHLLPLPGKYTPTIALLSGLLLSFLFSHPHNLIAAIFMGYFYGYAAIGSYAALRTAFRAYRKDKHDYR